MKKIVRYDLDFETSHKHFLKNLSRTNNLSSKLVETLEFNDGTFFTLLPEGMLTSEIKEFKRGGMAIGVRDFVNTVIMKMLSDDNSLSCVFDDVATTFRNNYNDPFFYYVAVL